MKSVTVVIDTTAPSGAAGDPGSYLRGIALLAYCTPTRTSPRCSSSSRRQA